MDLWLIITDSENLKKEITFYKMGMYYLYNQREIETFGNQQKRYLRWLLKNQFIFLFLFLCSYELINIRIIFSTIGDVFCIDSLYLFIFLGNDFLHNNVNVFNATELDI